MVAGEDFAARARGALDVVSRDTLSHDRFTRAYTGTGDAVTFLRAAADPAADHAADQRLDELRKTAFGRTLTAAEEDAATAARQELHDVERLRAQNVDALDRAIRALGGSLGTDLTDPSPPDDATPAATRPTRILRRIWIVPIVALCLATAYGNTALSTHWTGPASSPAASGSRSVTRLHIADARSAAQSGSQIAADEWFSQPQGEEDTIDAPTILDDLGIEPATTRYVGTTVHGALLWIAKRADRSYCVVGMRPWNGGTFGSCTSLDDFVRAGLELTQGRDSVRWDGIHFTTSSTTSNYGCIFTTAGALRCRVRPRAPAGRPAPGR